MNRDSAGFQGIVTQPIYTSGRISSGIDAAHSSIHAHQADLCRTMLDVKMNVAESFVAVLRATRLVNVARAKVASLSGHRRDVGSLFEKGLVSKNDFLSANVALADAQQQALDAHNSLEMAHAAYNRALGRNLADPVHLAELQDDGARADCETMTAQAIRQRPELATLAAQGQGLAAASRKRAGEERPAGAAPRRLPLPRRPLRQPQRRGGRAPGCAMECDRHGPRPQRGQRPVPEGRGGDPHAARRRIDDRPGSSPAVVGIGNGPAASPSCASGDCPGRRRSSAWPATAISTKWARIPKSSTQKLSGCRLIRIFSTVPTRPCWPGCGCGEHLCAVGALTLADASPVLVETSCLDRLLEPVTQCFTPEVAERLISLPLDPTVQARIEELANKANEGQLSDVERAEYEEYIPQISVVGTL